MFKLNVYKLNLFLLTAFNLISLHTIAMPLFDMAFLSKVSCTEKAQTVMAPLPEPPYGTMK